MKESRLEKTLSNEEKKIYSESMKKYRKTYEYHEIKSLNKTWQYNNVVIAENVARGYARGMVLGYRELQLEIDYRNKHFTKKI